MAANHFIVPSIPSVPAQTVRLGAGNAANQRMSDVDVGKFVKLVGESRFDMCAVGDLIEGVIVDVRTSTANGFSVGSIFEAGKMFVTANGLQGTPGTGNIAIGDLVVAGTPVAKGTAMSGYAAVCTATSQAMTRNAWRVQSLGQLGTGAPGTVIVIAKL